MTIYVDFAQDEHGFYFTRTDIYNNDASRIYWDWSGEIYYTEYENYNPEDNTLTGENRRINYSSEFDSHTMSWKAGSVYTPSNPVTLSEQDDNETYVA